MLNVSKPIDSIRSSARRSTWRGSPSYGSPSGLTTSQIIRPTLASPSRGRHQAERGGIGDRDHVGLLDRVEAGDRRAVEAHPVVQRALDLGRRDREALEVALDVREPEEDVLDALLGHRSRTALRAFGSDVARSLLSIIAIPPAPLGERTKEAPVVSPRQRPLEGDHLRRVDVAEAAVQRLHGLVALLRPGDEPLDTRPGGPLELRLLERPRDAAAPPVAAHDRQAVLGGRRSVRVLDQAGVPDDVRAFESGERAFRPGGLVPQPRLELVRSPRPAAACRRTPRVRPARPRAAALPACSPSATTSTPVRNVGGLLGADLALLLELIVDAGQSVRLGERDRVRLVGVDERVDAGQAELPCVRRESLHERRTDATSAVLGQDARRNERPAAEVRPGADPAACDHAVELRQQEQPVGLVGAPQLLRGDGLVRDDPALESRPRCRARRTLDDAERRSSRPLELPLLLRVPLAGLEDHQADRDREHADHEQRPDVDPGEARAERGSSAGSRAARTSQARSSRSTASTRAGR